MSDAEIRSLERAVNATRSVELLAQLDAVLARHDGGPWLPVLAGDSWRWNADAYLMLRLPRPGTGVSMTRVPQATLREWTRRITDAAAAAPMSVHEALGLLSAHNAGLLVASAHNAGLLVANPCPHCRMTWGYHQGNCPRRIRGGSMRALIWDHVPDYPPTVEEAFPHEGPVFESTPRTPEEEDRDREWQEILDSGRDMRDAPVVRLPWWSGGFTPPPEQAPPPP